MQEQNVNTIFSPVNKEIQPQQLFIKSRNSSNIPDIDVSRNTKVLQEITSLEELIEHKEDQRTQQTQSKFASDQLNNPMMTRCESNLTNQNPFYFSQVSEITIRPPGSQINVNSQQQINHNSEQLINNSDFSKQTGTTVPQDRFEDKKETKKLQAAIKIVNTETQQTQDSMKRPTNQKNDEQLEDKQLHKSVKFSKDLSCLTIPQNDEGTNLPDKSPIIDYTPLREKKKAIKRLQSFDQGRQKTLQKFKKVTHVIKSVNRLRINEVKPINTPEKLEQELVRHRVKSCIVPGIQHNDQIKELEEDQQKELNQEIINDKPQYNLTHFDAAVMELRRTEQFCQFSQLGTPTAIEQMNKIYEKDPRKYAINSKDPNHLINRRNTKGYTPLYIACLNGNFSIVKYLIQLECDPMIQSTIQKDILETPLEVSIRWNHYDIVKYILEHNQFPQSYLRNCIRLIHNKEIKTLMDQYVQKKKSICCF